MDEERLSIGRFARLAGLSVGALRHDHEQGSIEPASVDPDTGYRSDRSDQLDDARPVARLRELGLGLPEVRRFLAADAPERHRGLAAHRSRMLALLARTQRQVHWPNQAIDHEEPIVPPASPEFTGTPDEDRALVLSDLATIERQMGQHP